MVQLSNLYMPTGKTIPLTLRTFVGQVMSLIFNTLSRFVIAFQRQIGLGKEFTIQVRKTNDWAAWRPIQKLHIEVLTELACFLPHPQFLSHPAWGMGWVPGRLDPAFYTGQCFHDARELPWSYPISRTHSWSIHFLEMPHALCKGWPGDRAFPVRTNWLQKPGSLRAERSRVMKGHWGPGGLHLPWPQDSADA